MGCNVLPGDSCGVHPGITDGAVRWAATGAEWALGNPSGTVATEGRGGVKVRHAEIVAERMRRSGGCERHSVDSRQQKAARARKQLFEEVNTKYGPEPRRARRGITLTLARKRRKAA